MTALRLASRRDPLVAFHLAQEEIHRRMAKRRRWTWVKREAHWLAFAGTMVTGGMLWGAAFLRAPYVVLRILAAVGALVLCVAGIVALMLALLLSEEA